MIPYEDYRELKPKKSSSQVVSGSSHPLKPPSPKFSNRAANLFRQREQESLNNSSHPRSTQPKPSNTLRPPTRTQPSAQLLRSEGITRREWNNAQPPQPKSQSVQPNKAKQLLRQEERNFTNHASKVNAIAPSKKAPVNKSVPFSSNKATQLQRQELRREEHNLINHSSKANAIAPPGKEPIKQNAPFSFNKATQLLRQDERNANSRPDSRVIKPVTQPKPTPGSAADLPAAHKALQKTLKANQDLKANPGISSRGRLREMEQKDLRQDIGRAKARVEASTKAKALQDFHANPGISNRGGLREREHQDLQQEASSANARYMSSQGLDSSGQPIKFTPVEPPKPERKKSWWDKGQDFAKEKTSDAWDKTKSAGNYAKDHAKGIGHTALDVGGFIPVVGAVFDGANAVWYLAEGDKVNAALSGASAIPFAGDALAAGKLATKGVIAAKGLKSASEAKKVADVTDEVVDAAKVGGRSSRIKKNNSVGKLTEHFWKKHFDAEVKAGNLEVHIPQTTLKSPTTSKTMELSGKRRVLDNYIKEPNSGQGIAVETKATPRAAESAEAEAQSRRTQAGINQGAVAGNKKDGYHQVDAQVTKVGLPILGPGGNTGLHLLDPPLNLPHLL